MLFNRIQFSDLLGFSLGLPHEMTGRILSQYARVHYRVSRNMVTLSEDNAGTEPVSNLISPG
jgi:hypothetical protein